MAMLLRRLPRAVLEDARRLHLGQRRLGAEAEDGLEPVVAGPLDDDDAVGERLEERLGGGNLSRHGRDLVPHHGLVLQLLAERLAPARVPVQDRGERG